MLLRKQQQHMETMCCCTITCEHIGRQTMCSREQASNSQACKRKACKRKDCYAKLGQPKPATAKLSMTTKLVHHYLGLSLWCHVRMYISYVYASIHTIYTWFICIHAHTKHASWNCHAYEFAHPLGVIIQALVISLIVRFRLVCPLCCVCVPA